jgi:hypothetical protein
MITAINKKLDEEKKEPLVAPDISEEEVDNALTEINNLPY